MISSDRRILRYCLEALVFLPGLFQVFAEWSRNHPGSGLSFSLIFFLLVGIRVYIWAMGENWQRKRSRLYGDLETLSNKIDQVQARIDEAQAFNPTKEVSPPELVRRLKRFEQKAEKIRTELENMNQIEEKSDPVKRQL